MIALYHSGIILFSWLLHLASVFNPKARKLIQGRKDIPKVLDRIQPGEKIIWFHCASLGEFEQGRPLMEKIKKNYTDYKILLTFFSPSGYEIRKKYENADYITYLPFDTPRNARSFIKKVRPEKAIFVKYEFLYFFLREVL
jgi:3-deoxy-D-manno-octulosonic-acid transferase